MSSSYAGNDTYPTSFDLPDDGDDLEAASVNVALEALADRTTYLKERTAYSVVNAKRAEISGTKIISTSGSIFDNDITLSDVRVGDIVDVTLNLRFRTTGDRKYANVYLHRGAGAEPGNVMIMHDLARIISSETMPSELTASHTCRFVSSVSGDSSTINAHADLDAGTSLVVQSAQLIVTVIRPNS